VRRGFKTEAEERAVQVRRDMGLAPSDGLSAIDLARHVGAEVRRADELTSLEKLATLDEIQPGAFSACTFEINGRHIIAYNPLCSAARTQSDIAHEVAHIVLGHEIKVVHNVGGLRFFTCDPDEEQEANWLGACLLLPRPLLLRAAQRNFSASRLAQEYGVSEQMAAFRLRATGVVRQLQAARRKR
jgi:Zn-dependent peptidase ImmA (M78 family)